MTIPQELAASAQTILDVGGWFIPEPRATHVVDLMPWETRGARLNLDPDPGERFTKETWFQADFLSENFALPFPDKTFDLVLCGQTVEDLADPSRLLDEMQRVGKSGIIECPSRLTEQTVGIRDRESSQPGHPHHHWIVDREKDGLALYRKQDSGLDQVAARIPLLFFECFSAGRRDELKTMQFVWRDRFDYRLVRGPECLSKAAETVSELGILRAVRIKDRVLRWARRSRSRLQGRGPENFDWWKRIVEESRQYSSIDLP